MKDKYSNEAKELIMGSNNHSKLPWAQRDTEIVGSYGSNETICEIASNNKNNELANAAFICKAANTHDNLLNALKEALQIIERMSDEYSEVAKKHASFTQGEYKRINQAIKNAE